MSEEEREHNRQSIQHHLQRWTQQWQGSSSPPGSSPPRPTSQSSPPTISSSPPMPPPRGERRPTTHNHRAPPPPTQTGPQQLLTNGILELPAHAPPYTAEMSNSVIAENGVLDLNLQNRTSTDNLGVPGPNFISGTGQTREPLGSTGSEVWQRLSQSGEQSVSSPQTMQHSRTQSAAVMGTGSGVVGVGSVTDGSGPTLSHSSSTSRVHQSVLPSLPEGRRVRFQVLEPQPGEIPLPRGWFTVTLVFKSHI